MKYVIPDIHGSSQSLKALFEKVGFGKDDKIIFLGDYINKGHDSAGVLDFLISLQEQNFDVIFLMGNHEKNLLEAYQEYDHALFSTFVKLNKSHNLLDEHNNLIEKYLLFCQKCFFYLELEEFIMVHAGFNLSKEDIFEDKRALLEKKEFDYDPIKFRNKTIIRGHQIVPIEKIKASIQNREKIISLDNACYYRKKHKIYEPSQIGNLCCLNLDTWELILQKNVDNLRV